MSSVVFCGSHCKSGNKVTLVSSSEDVVRLLLNVHLLVWKCFLFSCDLCLFSPFSFGPLSEVLLGKLQHVVLAVMQRSLIQISVSKLVQGNPLMIQKVDSNHRGAILSDHFSREADAPLWFDQFRALPWWTPRPRPRRRTLRTDPLLPAALPFGPTAATGSPGPRLGGRSQPEMSRSD